MYKNKPSIVTQQALFFHASDYFNDAYAVDINLFCTTFIRARIFFLSIEKYIINTQTKNKIKIAYPHINMEFFQHSL